MTPNQIIKGVARKEKLEITSNILSRTFGKIRYRQDYMKVMKEKEKNIYVFILLMWRIG
jgi:hypothetical protein